MKDSSIAQPVLRALPKVLIVGVAVAALFSGNPLLVGLALLVLVLQLFINWRAWVNYVRTGTKPAPVVPAEFAKPGPYSVELIDVGSRSGQVVKAIRQITGLGLLAAKKAADSVPTPVATNVGADSAIAAVARLHVAGAKAQITPPLGG